jgi:hypothetical protein
LVLVLTQAALVGCGGEDFETAGDEAGGAGSAIATSLAAGCWRERPLGARMEDDGRCSTRAPTPAVDRSITLNWSPPLTNTDGSPVTNLVGYRVYYGSEAGAYVQSVDVLNPQATTYRFDDMPSGTYYLVVRALSASAVSDVSSEVSKTIL